MLDHRDLSADLPGRNITLHYRDWGGNGAPIVLLHGLASGARIWDLTAPYLVPQRWVLAVDQRGHGLSDKPDDGYGFDAVTGDLAAFIELLDLDRPIVVGHSWGGGVALQFAADHPGAVRGIVLVDGGFAPMDAALTWDKAERIMRPPEIDGLELERFLGFAKNWPDVKELWSDQLQDMILSNFEVKDGKIYRRLPVPKHMKIARAIWEQRGESLWERVTCPVLMIPAMREPANNREKVWHEAKLRGIEQVQARVRDARVVTMDDTIHDVPIQRPLELAEAIADFATSISA